MTPRERQQQAIRFPYYNHRTEYIKEYQQCFKQLRNSTLFLLLTPIVWGIVLQSLGDMGHYGSRPLGTFALATAALSLLVGGGTLLVQASRAMVRGRSPRDAGFLGEAEKEYILPLVEELCEHMEISAPVLVLAVPTTGSLPVCRALVVDEGRRIVVYLYDGALLLSDEDLRALLAHELGHVAHADTQFLSTSRLFLASLLGLRIGMLLLMCSVVTGALAMSGRANVIWGAVYLTHPIYVILRDFPPRLHEAVKNTEFAADLAALAYAGPEAMHAFQRLLSDAETLDGTPSKGERIYRMLQFLVQEARVAPLPS